MEIPNTLFSESKRKELCSGKNITRKQKQAIKKWKEDLDNDRFQGESHYKDYLRDLMIDALGYPRDQIKAEEGEKRTELDYSYIPSSGKGGVLFELKNRKKKPFKPQGYVSKGQETPVDQALSYIGVNPDINYAIVTNFEEFVLLTRDSLKSQCYKFTFPPKGMKLLDSEILEFATIFSKESIDSKFIETLKHETIVEEKDLSDDFYRIYHQTRLMLIKAFQEKSNIDNDKAIKLAQMYLNRLIFLFFAEDNNLVKKDVFSGGILSLLDSGDIKNQTTKVSDYIQTLFSWMNEGSFEIDHKLGFNGEFFKEPIDRNAFFYDFRNAKFFEEITNKFRLPKNVKLNKEYQKSIDRYDGHISPIITNLLIMDAYNFGEGSATGEYISVNILGRVFEQSIGDLEELHNQQVSQRKREGVFYTPEYVTEYICKNTIIPYLSKNGSTEPYQLVMEYKDNIPELEQRLEQVKILDPACGSGAFLVKAIDTLLSIYDEIHNLKESRGAYTTTKKGKKSSTSQYVTFDKGLEMERIRSIIQNNIYGVDINSESVEITKLSLFLKIASKNKRLVELSDRIRVGNSLIDDQNVVPNAFDWAQAFPEKFDIVIGNPPYVRQEMFKEIKHYLKSKYACYSSIADLYVYFVEKGINLLKDKGILTFILPNKFLKAEYGRNLRNTLLKKIQLKTLYNFDDYPVFDDATTYPLIMSLQNKYDENVKIHYSELKNNNTKTPIIELKKSEIEFLQSDLTTDSWLFTKSESLTIIKKIQHESISLKEFTQNKIFRGISTGKNDVFIIDENVKKTLQDTQSSKIIKKIVTGSEVKRYRINFQNKFLLFITWDYDLRYSDSIKTYLESHKEELSERPEVKEGRFNWWSLSRYGSKNSEFLSQPKIIYPRITNQSNFCLDNSGEMFLSDNNFFISSGSKSLLAVLNSKLIFFFLKQHCPTLQGGYFDFRRPYIEKIPICRSLDENDEKLSQLVSEIIQKKSDYDAEDKYFWNSIKLRFGFEKIPKKLKCFLELDFNSFFSELNQFAKIPIDLNNPNEVRSWNENFDNTQKKLKNISQEIKELECQVDNIVYQMYGLTKDEIETIENSLNDSI